MNYNTELFTKNDLYQNGSLFPLAGLTVDGWLVRFVSIDGFLPDNDIEFQILDRDFVLGDLSFLSKQTRFCGVSRFQTPRKKKRLNVLKNIFNIEFFLNLISRGRTL